MEIFLTFLIITYQRPAKVVRLLELFLDDRWSQLKHLQFEIVIADDHGEDATWETIEPVVNLLHDQGWQVRYVYREDNLRGDRNLYYGYTRDSAGKFVWFLCDDDLLNIAEAIQFIQTVHDTNPLIGICGFRQGLKGEYGNRLGSEVKLVKSFPEAVDYLIQFPKTTAYLLRRFTNTNLDDAFERWDRTLFSWIGISIYLLAINKENGVLIYPGIVAYADEDFGVLRYSYRVFGKLPQVTQDSIELAGVSFDQVRPKLINLATYDEVNQCVTGLYAHYSWRSHIKYTNDVLMEETRFLRKNWISIFKSRQRTLSFIKLALYFLGSHAISR